MSQVSQPLLFEKTVRYIDSITSRARVKMNGVYVDYPIFKSIIEGNTLRKYIYLQTEPGNVEEAQILTDQNELLLKQSYDIEKDENGLVIAFACEVIIN